MSAISRGNSQTFDLTLPTHENIQRELRPYMEIMRLLKALDNKAFVQLTNVYTKTMGSLYQRDFKYFFDEAKEHLLNKRPQNRMVFIQKLIV